MMLNASSRSPRGVTLVEVGIAIVILGILILSSFGFLAWAQIFIIEENRQSQLETIVHNEAKRLMSIPYGQIPYDPGAGTDPQTFTQVIDTDGLDVTLTTSVSVEYKQTGVTDPHWKKVIITGTNSAGETASFTIYRAP